MNEFQAKYNASKKFEFISNKKNIKYVAKTL